MKPWEKFILIVLLGVISLTIVLIGLLDMMALSR